MKGTRMPPSHTEPLWPASGPFDEPLAGGPPLSLKKKTSAAVPHLLEHEADVVVQGGQHGGIGPSSLVLDGGKATQVLLGRLERVVHRVERQVEEEGL
jgi:hypothetical protein